MARVPAANGNEPLIAAEKRRLLELEREREATLARIASLRERGDESSIALSPASLAGSIAIRACRKSWRVQQTMTPALMNSPRSTRGTTRSTA